MSFFVFKATLMSLLPFYHVNFPVDLFPKELAYVEFSQGRELGKKTLTEKERGALEEMLVKNKDEWRYDVKTYAPGPTYTSSTMKINCEGRALVVNYPDKDNGWIQISKKNSVGTCPVILLDEKKDTENGGNADKH